MRYTYRWLLACLMPLLLSGCRPEKPASFGNGVSRELAVHRKEVISGLKYALSFVIPAERDSAVTGQAEIRFSLEKPGEVVLDFREGADKIKELKVNGKAAGYHYEEEHIIIPSKAFRAGENRVDIRFIAGEQSLNRNEDYLYTLLVPDRARTVFPCFDQPDLKASFTLSLEVPGEWVAVSNSPVEKMEKGGVRNLIVFKETEPLSTYLFSFVAGRFRQAAYDRDGRNISVFHRETDGRKLEQLPVIAGQVFDALNWLEDYTGVPYPFAKYDLIILPGFQYGGMEHTGATLYNDRRMFLPEHPTVQEEMGRAQLIAHETAHMWFGDYVTMEWFDDVWTKEVFANYFAARMVEPLFPQINHELNALQDFYASSYSEDRTAGSNAIKQPLDNLNDAGLIYGQIIYNKAPVVMSMLVDMMGEEAFKEGIREYLTVYAYGNATWEGLVEILNKRTVGNLKMWSQVWVHEKGMPHIGVRRVGEDIVLAQNDPFGRGINWPQKVGIMLLAGDSVKEVQADLKTENVVIPVPGKFDYIIPGCDGKSYGYFMPDSAAIRYCLGHLSHFKNPVTRMTVCMTLNENRINGRIAPADLTQALLKHLPGEENILLYSAMLGYIGSCSNRLDGDSAVILQVENTLLDLSRKAPRSDFRQMAFRTLVDLFRSPSCTGLVRRIWAEQSPFPGLQLNESDYIRMAYELAVRLPEQADSIINRQVERIKNPDRVREFRYIARALNPDLAVRDSLFYSLQKPENRRIEPWTGSVLYYLNHPLRQQQALKYIRPALEVLQEVQRTGDIFFPKNWVSASLRGHYSVAAADSVQAFLHAHPDYPVLLKNKILQSADHLLRLEGRELNSVK